ncbi:hypothetical protein [Brevundimonas sp.]|uniref:hypothetical protein n=1 Tax=Brevundimonas sp. TaxID=1871086 RepID=UPI002ABA6AC2|nr:hypothetical protein [Brevundimonas sp.]MDZ4364969.1 hypothetical protein [Brevundimonas sp.]
MSEQPPATATGPTLDRVLVEVTVPAPADAVWAALRDPDQIKAWFGWDADTLADEIDFIFVKHAVADEATRTIHFQGTQDRYEVEAKGAESIVRIVRAAPADQEWSDIFDAMTEGWIAFTEQLRFAFARHRGEARRTVFLAGIPKEGHEGLLRGALGLTTLGAPGESWAQDLGPDGPATGEVWHVGRRQTGLTVRHFGDGLLVLMEREPDEKHPLGEVSATLTTYGLADADFAALESGWKAWWAERFTSAALPSAD